MSPRQRGADDALKAFRDEFEIAEHAVTESLDHTGLDGDIGRTPNLAAHRQARCWHRMVNAGYGTAQIVRVRSSPSRPPWAR